MNITLADIKHWMRHGPDNERSLPRTMVANWVYWRHYAAMIAFLPFFMLGHATVTGIPQATWSYVFGIISWLVLSRVYPNQTE